MNFKKMVPDHKSTWLEGLRSGKYKQGQGHLRQSNGEDVFCCLGVLQDVIQPEDWVKPQDCSGLDDNAKVWAVPEVNGYDGTYDDPTYNDGEIQERLLDETNLDSSAMEKLIKLNDGRYANDDDRSEPRIDIRTFNEIADWIEENL